MCEYEKKYNELLIKFQQLDHDKFWDNTIPKCKVEEILKKYEHKQANEDNAMAMYTKFKELLKENRDE